MSKAPDDALFLLSVTTRDGRCTRHAIQWPSELECDQRVTDLGEVCIYPGKFFYIMNQFPRSIGWFLEHQFRLPAEPPEQDWHEPGLPVEPSEDGEPPSTKRATLDTVYGILRIKYL